MRLISRIKSTGTSPRVRGKHEHGNPELITYGYIPASAGEASSPKASPVRRQVHPRECGGSKEFSEAGVSRTGTSPRVRGKQRAVEFSEGCSRYIPASAGEAFVLHLEHTGHKVHPRECGGSP